MPNSGQYASSFHLPWQYLPADAPLYDVGVTLEILTAPTVEWLYYWALQLSLPDGGACHIGLQHHPFDDVERAANFGGYHPDHSQYDGSALTIPSVHDNPNTGLYDWQPNTAYRLRIFWDAVTGTWQGSINEQVLRGLYVPAGSAASPQMWSEVFAECTDPGVEVRWSHLYANCSDGRVFSPRTVLCHYNDDTCPNVDSRVEGKVGFRQITRTTRANPNGQIIRLEEPVHLETFQMPTLVGGKGKVDTGIAYERLAGKPFVNGDPSNPPTTANELEPCNYNGQIRVMAGLFTNGAAPSIKVPIYD